METRLWVYSSGEELEKPRTRIGVIDPRPFSQLQTPGHTYVEQSFNLQKVTSSEGVHFSSAV